LRVNDVRSSMRMDRQKIILIINGSASEGSSNERLADRFASLVTSQAVVRTFPPLRTLPHFDPAAATGAIPQDIVALHEAVSGADGVLFFTPEYIFSIPSGLKNLLEWCVAVTVFSDKPAGIITASAHGARAHEELQLILRTLGARLNDECCLLIQGVKAKIDQEGMITDAETERRFRDFTQRYLSFI